MKLHLPLGLLSALMAVMAVMAAMPGAVAAAVSVDVASGTTGALEYGVYDNMEEGEKREAIEREQQKWADGMELTVEKGGRYSISNPWIKVGGTSTWTVKGSLVHSAGQIAYGESDSLTIHVEGGAFEIKDYAREGCGSEASLDIEVTDGGEFAMRNGLLSCGGGRTHITVDQTSRFVSNIGFVAHNGGTAQIDIKGGEAHTETAVMGAAHAPDPQMPKDSYGNDFCPEGNSKRGEVSISVSEGGSWRGQGWFGQGTGEGYTGVANLTITGKNAAGSKASTFVMESGLTSSVIAYGEDGGSGEAHIHVEVGAQWIQESGCVGLAENGGKASFDIEVTGEGSRYLMSGGEMGKEVGEGSEVTGTITLGDNGVFEMTGGKVWEGVTVDTTEGGRFLHTGGDFGGALKVGSGSYTQESNGAVFSGTVELGEKGTYYLNAGEFRGTLEGQGESLFQQNGGTFTGTLVLGEQGRYELKAGTLKADLNISAGTYEIINGRIEDKEARNFVVSGSGVVRQQWDTLGDEGGEVTITVGGGESTGGVYELGGTAALGSRAKVVVDEGGELNVTTRAGAVNRACVLNVEVKEGGELVMNGATNGGDITLGQGSVFTMDAAGANMVSTTVHVNQGARLSAENGLFTSSSLIVDGGEVSLGKEKGVTREASSSPGFTMNAGSIVVRNAGVVNQNDAVVKGTIRLDGGTYQQAGDSSIVSLQVSQGTYTQEAGTSLTAADANKKTSGVVEVKGKGIMVQEKEAKADHLQVRVNDEGQFRQFGQMTDVSIEVNSGSFEQSGFISGKTVVNGGSYHQAKDSIFTGDVLANGGAFRQEGTLNGNATVSGQGSYTQQGVVVGQVIVEGGEYVQEAGDIDLGVIVRGGQATTKGNVDGGVEVRGGSYTLAGGVVSGKVTLTGKNSSLLQKAGDVASTEILVADGAKYTMEDGTLSGNINISGSGSVLLQRGGTIKGSVNLNSGATLTQESGLIEKEITLSGNSTFSQQEGGVAMNGITLGMAGVFNENGGTMHGVTTLLTTSVVNMTAGTIDSLEVKNGGTVNQQGGLVTEAKMQRGTYNLSGGELKKITLGDNYYSVRLVLSKDGKLGDALVTGKGSVDYFGGQIEGSVTLDGKETSFVYRGGDMGTTGEIVAQDATISAMADGMNGRIVLRGDAARLALHGYASSADVTLEGGRITEGSGFNGKLHVDTSQYLTDLSGIRPETIKGFNLRRADGFLYNIEEGELTLTDKVSSLVVGSTTAAATVYFRTFGGGSLSFADDAKIVVNFDASLLKDVMREDGQSIELSFNLTNGTIVQADEIGKHLSLGAGLGEGVNVVWSENEGRITATLTLKGLLFASNYVAVGKVLDASQGWETLKDLNKAFLDEDLTLKTDTDHLDKVVLKQLAGEGMHTLTVQGEKELVFENKHTDGENGNTDVYGNILSDSTRLLKEGDAALTVHGTVVAQGGLKVMEGRLGMLGGGRVNGLEVASGAELELGGQVEIKDGTIEGKVTGEADVRSEGTLNVTGEEAELSGLRSLSLVKANAVVDNGGKLAAEEITLGEDATLEVKNGVVQGKTCVNSGGALVAGDNATMVGDVAVGDGGKVTTGKAQIDGSLSLGGEKARWEATGTLLTGDLFVSGKETVVRMGETGTIGGSVFVDGESADVTLSGEIKGSVVLSGAGSKLDLSGTQVGEEVLFHRGEITGATGFEGQIAIDLDSDVSGEVKLSGVDGASIKSVQTHGKEGVHFSGLATGSCLQLSGEKNTVVVGGDNVAGRDGCVALFGFSGGDGKLGFAEGGKLKLQLADALYENLESYLENRKLRLKITDGSFDFAGEEDALKWVKEHFLLATGSSMSFLAKEFVEAEEGSGGEIVLGLIKDTTMLDVRDGHEVDADAMAEATQVIVKKNLTLTANDEATVRQLRGEGNMVIKGSHTVTLLNETYDYYNGDTVFEGSITATEGADIVKSGNAILEVGGDVVTSGSLTVSKGRLSLYGTGSRVGQLVMPEGEEILEVKGALKVMEESKLEGGTLSGDGLIEVQKGLTVGAEVAMTDGPSMYVARNATLTLLGREVTMGALSGEGTVCLDADGATLILSKNTGVFLGNIKGKGSIELKGNVNQTFVGLNNDELAIRSLDESACLTFRGENRIKSLTTSGTLVIEGHVETQEGNLTNNRTEFAVPFGSAGKQALMEVTGGNKSEIGNASTITIGLAAGSRTLGSGDLDLVLLRNKNGIVKQGGDEFEDGEQLPQVELSWFLKYFYDDLVVTVEAEPSEEEEAIMMAAMDVEASSGSPKTVLLAKAVENVKTGTLTQSATSANSRSGAELLESMAMAVVKGSVPISFSFEHVLGAVMQAVEAGATEEAARIMAAAVGSTVTAPSSALRDEVRDQLVRVRDHAAEAEVSGTQARNVSAWVAAEGDFRELDTDGDESGYKLNTWGGSVGADMRMGQATTVGLSITALYGDLDAHSADTASGSLDTYWLSFYARTKKTAWGHSFVMTLGTASADLDRTVDYGEGAYRTSGSTDGYSVGFLYELTYDKALNEEKTQMLRPYFQAAILHASLDGWDEKAADGLGLRVDDQENTLARLGIGVRWMADVDSPIAGGKARFTFGVGVAQDFGDTRSEADVAFCENPGTTASIRGAEAGRTSVQLDLGASVPVSPSSFIYLNGHGDLRSGASAWGVSVGLRKAF